MANVQISEELFFQLFRYHCIPHEVFSDEDLHVMQQAISDGLEKKVESMAMRGLYTKYKTAETPEERLKAKNEYLDKKGIHRDWRW